MKPLRLIAENFMNHRYSDIDCSIFCIALIVAKEKHNDSISNGIGKTTIFSAIEYALFGEVPTSILDHVVRFGADKCVVSFDFETIDGIYRIVRGRSAKGRSDLKLYSQNGTEWESIAQRSMPETEKKIAEIIKINHKAFSHSIKFGQADLKGLASASNKDERQSILKEPLQLGDYTKLDKIASERAKPLKKEIERVETSIQMLGDPLADSQAAESELQVSDSLIKSKTETIEKLSATITEKHALINELKKSLNSDDTVIHDKILELNKRNKELKGSISKSNEKVQENDKIISEGQITVAGLRKTILDIEQNIEIKQLRQKTQVSADIAKVETDELYGTKLLAKFEAEYDQANKNMPNGNVCPHCLQEITEEHREKCEKETTLILAEKSGQIESTKTNLTKCFNKKKKLQVELQEIVSFEKSEQSKVQNKEKAKSELEIRLKHIKEAEVRLSESAHDMQIFQIELNGVNEKLNQLKDVANNSSASSDINAKIFVINDEIKVYDRSLLNVRNELSSAQIRHGAAQEKLKTSKNNAEKLIELSKDDVILRKRLKYIQLAINGFCPSGIPTFIINTIIDELQLETNKWLNKLRPEISLQFDKDINISFKINDSLRYYEQLSIGQHVYIALSLKLGLSRIIQNKLGIDVKFLLLDEVEAPLDKAGVEAYAEVVKKLQNDFKIFIITHNDLLKDKFSHIITVEGDGENGASTRIEASQ